MAISEFAPIAHVKFKPDGTPDEQLLKDHLKGVADLANDFAGQFGAKDWGYLLGMLHDAGKFSDGWQLAIRQEIGYDLDAFIEIEEGKGNHSTLGAIVMSNGKALNRTQKVLAYAVAGHHAGLPDWEPGDLGDCLLKRLFAGTPSSGIDSALRNLWDSVKKKADFIATIGTLSPPVTPPLSPHGNGGVPPKPETYHLWIRMLFSCLVDADYLDTERFMDYESFKRRGQYANLKDLKERLDLFMSKKSAAARPGRINDIRRKVLEACRKKALSKPGIFTLTVPTGTGKTLASMVFALDHAIENNQRRIIVAIPYTSIIEQTAKVYKYGTDIEDEIADGRHVLFGEENVVEHHSNIDPDNQTQESRFATENWDAPVIVTTNVQLFESLSASRPSACRKLHNIANSVIILDETQLLPPPFLRSILANLQHLVDYFGVTVLLCTATQPALTGTIGSGNIKFAGLASTTEIYDRNREELFQSLKRVEFHLPRQEHRYESWETLANELSDMERTLCVVNTRQSARDLHTAMPAGTFHLSGLMCGEDRSDVIDTVKQCLKKNRGVRLISTQLIEAGVDVDFPVVYRAFAGLDSLIQAAGRCNREGLLAFLGKVVIFNAPVNSPRGLLAKGEDAARALLGEKSSFELSDELFEAYFREFYRTVNDFDFPKALSLMLKSDMALEYQFRTYAARYRLIDDSQQRAILIPYKSERTGRDGGMLIERLEERCDFGIMRQLQRFTVNVPEKTFMAMDRQGMLKSVGEGNFFTLSLPDLYQPGKGLMLDGEAFTDAIII